jgi:hypothetical protein
MESSQNDGDNTVMDLMVVEMMDNDKVMAERWCGMMIMVK